MMVRPIVNPWTKTRMHLHTKSVEMASKEGYQKEGIMCDIVCSKPLISTGVGIYMGVDYSEYYMAGVKKHHRLLVGDTLARLSGYDVRYLEPVVGCKIEDKD